MDRAPRQGARPRARGRPGRGPRGGLGRLGPQRGFLCRLLTHGLSNGLTRWPDEIHKLEELGARNLDGIEATVARYSLDCDFERTGEIDVATEPYQAAELRDWYEELERRGLANGVDYLDAEAVREQVDSPTFLAGLHDRRGVAMLHPAKLAWGLKRACVELGVRVYENTPALTLRPYGAGMAVRTPYGSFRARRVALGTNIFPNLVKRVRSYTVPVYDYALMTEPLTADQLASIGWKNRQGLGDSANQFHYFRLSADNRILWGGYDAVYPYGGRVRAEYDDRPETYAKLAGHFFTCFPQLEGVRFSHAWGGAIDTCSRFSAFFGTAHQGRVAYAAGYTGLGVGATRFGADVMLDLLSGSARNVRRWRWSARSRCPSRRSRSRGRGSRSPSGPWRGRTRTAAGAICG